MVVMKEVRSSLGIISCSDITRQTSTSIDAEHGASSVVSELSSLSPARRPLTLRYVTFLLYISRTSDAIHGGRVPRQASPTSDRVIERGTRHTRVL